MKDTIMPKVSILEDSDKELSYKSCHTHSIVLVVDAHIFSGFARAPILGIVQDDRRIFHYGPGMRILINPLCFRVLIVIVPHQHYDVTVLLKMVEFDIYLTAIITSVEPLLT